MKYKNLEEIRTYKEGRFYCEIPHILTCIPYGIEVDILRIPGYEPQSLKTIIKEQRADNEGSENLRHYLRTNGNCESARAALGLFECNLSDEEIIITALNDHKHNGANAFMWVGQPEEFNVQFLEIREPCFNNCNYISNDFKGGYSHLCINEECSKWKQRVEWNSLPKTIDKKLLDEIKGS